MNKTQSNRDKIYFYIRDKNLVTKQDIAYDLLLSLPTVTKNLEYFVEKGLIKHDHKVVNKSGGRRPIAYSYAADARLAIGIDIARNHIRTVITDLNGMILECRNRRQKYERTDEYLMILGDEVEAIIDSANVDRKKLLGAGIAIPGLVDHEKGYVVQGRVMDNTGMTCDDFSKYILYPTKLIHDSYASGFSEVWMSSEMHNVFYMNLCETLGGTVFLNDNVFLGDGLYSGEIGHTNLIPNGEKCYCGQRGCLDAYLTSTILSNSFDGNLEHFFQKLGQGKKELQKIWDQYTDYLAVAINDVRMVYGCTIILGGYVGAYLKEYMEAIHKKVDVLSPFSEASVNYLVPCKNTKEAVATGAALYFIQEFLNNISENEEEQI